MSILDTLPEFEDLDKITVVEAKSRLNYIYQILNSCDKTNKDLTDETRQYLRDILRYVKIGLNRIMDYLDKNYNPNANATFVPGLDTVAEGYAARISAAKIYADDIEEIIPEEKPIPKPVKYVYVPEVTFSGLAGADLSNKDIGSTASSGTNILGVLAILGGIGLFAGTLYAISRSDSHLKNPPKYAHSYPKRSTEK